MSGRPKEKVHVYSLSAKYLRTFDCIADFRRHYWPEDTGNRPVLHKVEQGCNYEIIDEAEVIALKCRPGREAISLIIAIDSSEYCKQQDKNDDKVVQAFNLRGDLIAEYASQRLAAKLSGAHPVLISNHLNKQVGARPRKIFHGGLIFKYKE